MISTLEFVYIEKIIFTKSHLLTTIFLSFEYNNSTSRFDKHKGQMGTNGGF